MSQLNQLKGQVAGLAGEAKQTANSLAAYKAKFTQQVGQVTAVVGGSAQRVDQQMVETLRAAERQLDSAVAALHQAGQAAERYAGSL